MFPFIVLGEADFPHFTSFVFQQALQALLATLRWRALIKELLQRTPPRKKKLFEMTNRSLTTFFSRVTASGTIVGPRSPTAPVI